MSKRLADRTTRWLVSISAATMVAGGCATGPKVADVRLGMDESQVVSILGQPDGVKKEGDDVAYQYVNRLVSGWSWDKADYQVIFHQGHVTQYGAGTVRQDQSHGTLILVPLH